MKKVYEEPVMEVIKIDAADIVTASPSCTASNNEIECDCIIE